MSVSKRDSIPIFWNLSFNKGILKNFVSWCFVNYGQRKTIQILEKLQLIGFGYATKAGVSIGIDDLKIPPTKSVLLAESDQYIEAGFVSYQKSQLTGLEKFQRIIETWHNTSESLKDEMITNFRKIDILNPVFMMAFSGARGNVSQVRQLVSMRGLMSDPQGKILDFPIRSNFREGLTLTEYVISCYGARKGVVDTALRTANAGYLTRRLVDVAQHVIVLKFDCGTKKGFYLTEMKKYNKTLYPLRQRLLGRVLAANIYKNSKSDQSNKLLNGSLLNSTFSNKEIIGFRNEEISAPLAEEISKVTNKVFIRSPLTCGTPRLVCQLCYGWSLSEGYLVAIGEAVGVIAAQSIGEPGTQLTMRTFHTGGVFSGEMFDQLISPYDGFVSYSNSIPGTLIRTTRGKIAFLTKTEGKLSICRKTTSDTLSQSFKLPAYTVLFVRNNETILKDQLIAELAFVSPTLQKTGEVAEFVVKSEMEGQLCSGSVNILEKYTEYNDIMTKSIDWGLVWILSGKICQLPINSNFFALPGDLVNQNCTLSQIKWNVPIKSVVDTNLLLNGKDFRKVPLFQTNIKVFSNAQKQRVKVEPFLYKKWLQKKNLTTLNSFLNSKIKIHNALVRKNSVFSFEGLKLQKNFCFYPFSFFSESKQKPKVIKKWFGNLQNLEKKDYSLLVKLRKNDPKQLGKKFQLLQIHGNRNQKPHFSVSDYTLKKNNSLNPFNQKIVHFKSFQKNREIRKNLSFSNKETININLPVMFLPIDNILYKKVGYFLLFNNKNFCEYNVLDRNPFKISKAKRNFRKNVDKKTIFFPSRNIFIKKLVQKKYKNIFLKDNYYSNFKNVDQKIAGLSFLDHKQKKFSWELKSHTSSDVFFIPNFLDLNKYSFSNSINKKSKKFSTFKFTNKTINSLFHWFPKMYLTKSGGKYFYLFTHDFFSHFGEKTYSIKSNLIAKIYWINNNGMFTDCSSLENENCAFSSFKNQKSFNLNLKRFNLTRVVDIDNRKEKTKVFSLQNSSLLKKDYKDSKSQNRHNRNLNRDNLGFTSSTEKNLLNKKITQRNGKTDPIKSNNVSVFPLQSHFSRLYSFDYIQIKNYKTKFFNSWFLFLLKDKDKKRFPKKIKNEASLYESEGDLNFQKKGFKAESQKSINTILKYFYSNLKHYCFKNTKSNLKTIKLNYTLYKKSFVELHSTNNMGFVKSSSHNQAFVPKNQKELKTGWIYKPKNLASAISLHKKVIFPGQKIIDDLIIDNYPIYIECIPEDSKSLNHHNINFNRDDLGFTNSNEKNAPINNNERNGKTDSIKSNNVSVFPLQSHFSRFDSVPKEKKFQGFNKKNFFNIKKRVQTVNHRFLNFSEFLFKEKNRFKVKKERTNISFVNEKKKDYVFFHDSKIISSFSKILYIYLNFNGNEQFKTLNVETSKVLGSSFVLFLKPVTEYRLYKSSFYKKILYKLQKKSKHYFFNYSWNIKSTIFSKILKQHYHKDILNKQKQSLKLLDNFQSIDLFLKLKCKGIQKDFLLTLFTNTLSLQLYLLLCKQKTVNKKTIKNYSNFENFVFSLKLKKNFLKFFSMEFESKKPLQLVEFILVSAQQNLSKNNNNIEYIRIFKFFEKKKNNYSVQIEKRFFKAQKSQIYTSFDIYKKTNAFYQKNLKGGLLNPLFLLFFSRNPKKDKKIYVRTCHSIQSYFVVKPVGQNLNQIFLEKNYLVSSLEKNINKKFFKIKLTEIYFLLTSFSFEIKQRQQVANLFSKTDSVKFSQPFVLCNFPFVTNFLLRSFSPLNLFLYSFFYLYLEKKFIRKTFEGPQISFISSEFFYYNYFEKKVPLLFLSSLIKFGQSSTELNSEKRISKAKLFKNKIKKYSNFSDEIRSSGNLLEGYSFSQSGLKPKFYFNYYQKFPLKYFLNTHLSENYPFSSKEKKGRKNIQNFNSNYCKNSKNKFGGFFKSNLENYFSFYQILSIFQNNKKTPRLKGSNKRNNSLKFNKSDPKIESFTNFSRLYLPNKQINSFSFIPTVFQQPCFEIFFTKEISFGYNQFQNFQFSKNTYNLQMKGLNAKIYFNNNFNKKEIALTRYLSPFMGEILRHDRYYWLQNTQKDRYLILTKKDQISFSLIVNFNERNKFLSTSQFIEKMGNPKQLRMGINFSKINFKTYLGKFIKRGDYFSLNNHITGSSSDSGIVIHFNKSKVTLRKAQSFLLSPNCIFHYSHGDLVEKNKSLLSLPYKQLKTGDIVQGIPKVEQLLEARSSFKGKEEEDNLHKLLIFVFERYKTKFSLKVSVRKSLSFIQLILVNSVQRIYRSQGVSISDKHLEVIVKQMTSKVYITSRGDSSFFRGEHVDLYIVEMWNSLHPNLKKITYKPILLGISRSSLEVNSFLSAASFQHTKKVLSRSAFKTNIDFLNGLKENVIIGNLISAGTGNLNVKFI